MCKAKCVDCACSGAKTEAQMGAGTTFNDWAGQPIPYRIVPAEPGADEKLVCEIDPHGLCEWSSFGRGQNANAALQAATLAWNAYDRQT